MWYNWLIVGSSACSGHEGAHEGSCHQLGNASWHGLDIYASEHKREGQETSKDPLSGYIIMYEMLCIFIREQYQSRSDVHLFQLSLVTYLLKRGIKGLKATSSS